MPEAALQRVRAVVVGVSTGGIDALTVLLGGLPRDFPLPVLVVQHVSPDSPGGMALLLDRICEIHVKEADEGELLVGGTAYLAPANYHLLVEPDGTVALSTDPPVAFARPSVDVLFESAADAFGGALIGVILTGGGFDGSRGLRRIKDKGGIAVVQDPRDAAAGSMPEHAIMSVAPDYVLPLGELAPLFITLATRSNNGRSR